jgi:Dyp-type peroxidase family
MSRRAARDRIQEGVYFRSGERPAPCWRLLLLRVVPGAAPADVRDALGRVLRMLAALRAGTVRELRGQPAAGVQATRETFAGLAALVGYGRSLFDHDPPLTAEPRPEFLARLAAFPALPRAERHTDAGEADIALQLTGATPAAVNRAAVEVWKLLEDKSLPLRAAASFDGFGRPDGRGWLEFHDGVGNMPSQQRLAAIQSPPDPRWMAGGTYMAFLRLRVDLRAWRALDRGEQELAVGRDKLTGNPLTRTRRGAIKPAGAADRFDPPAAGDPLLASSHVHRANRNRGSSDSPAALRIFRQGYDFIDGIGPDGPELGLNFISFQADLQTLQHLMHLPGWLGDSNFGGGAPAFVSLFAGGLYAVPPRARPFPGAVLFA